MEPKFCVADALDAKLFMSFDIRGINKGNGEHVTFPPGCVCCGELGGRTVDVHSGGRMSENFGSLTKSRDYGINYKVPACEFCESHFEAYEKLRFRRSFLRFVSFLLPFIGFGVLLTRIYEPNHTNWYQVSFWIGAIGLSAGFVAGITLLALTRRWKDTSVALKPECTAALIPVEISFEPNLADVHSEYIPSKSRTHLSISGFRKPTRFLDELRSRNITRIVSELDLDQLEELHPD